MNEQVSQAFVAAMSADANQRKEGEKYLHSLKAQPGFSIIILQIIQANCADQSQRPLRQIASVFFKNLVKKGWEPDDDETPSIPEGDKAQIKTHLVEMMSSVPTEVQRQLSEALSIIATHDFPAKWEDLLPNLIQKFTVPDFNVIHGVLLTANSIMKRFRYVFKSDQLFQELKYCLDLLQEPLLILFKQISDAVTALSPATTATDPEQKPRLVLLIALLRLMSRIFFSLNWQDLPEYFEDHMAEWMEKFKLFLDYNNPLLVDETEEDEPGPLDRLQAAIAENINLYASKYEEEFQQYLQAFSQAIWELLMRVSQKQKHDPLATTSIRFLTSIISKKLHYDLFKDPNAQRQIVEKIVIPNLMLREQEAELFEDNPFDYIQMDMEGSDTDTRRRCAVELVRGMCRNYEESATPICQEYTVSLLTQYSTSQEERLKDAALHLTLAVAVKAQSVLRGASSINDKVNVMDIFTSHILPELSDADVNARPIVRADCIKFISVFRSQFNLEHLQQLLPLLIGLLRSSSVVVQTYAANCIERILMVKQKGAHGMVPIFNKENLQPHLNDLFQGLFGVFDNVELKENDYIMKAIMRTLNVAADTIISVASTVLEKLTAALARVCANPSNPRFNHYLMEAMATLLAQVCRANPAAANDFETALFPPFQQILAADVKEFTPYVFQLLSHLLELRPDGVSPAYMSLFPPLLSPGVWESRGNVPGLTRLLQAYLRKAASELVAGNHLTPMLGVFQKLLASKATEDKAFEFLITIFETIPLDQLQQFLPQIYQMMMMRLQQNKTARYIRFSTGFFSFIISKYGPGIMVDGLESMQQGLSIMVLQQVWLPNMATVTELLDCPERKAFAIGLTRLLCEGHTVQNDVTLWGKTLSAILSTLEPSSAEEAKAHEHSHSHGHGHGHSHGHNHNHSHDHEECNFNEEIGYDAVYAHLHFADTGEYDALKDMPEGKQYLVQQLNQLCASSPGKFGPVIQSALAPNHLAVLQNLIQQAGVTLS